MAVKNRKAAEAMVLKWVDEIIPNGNNGKIYRELFSNLDDEQFEAWIAHLEQGKSYVRVWSPPELSGTNEHPVELSAPNALRVGDKMGVKFFQRCWLTDPATQETTLTPIKYLVCHLPWRRQQQLREKKTSVPDDNLHINQMTGQVTGVSKSSSLSYAEWQIFYAKNLHYTGLEFAKLRGGDRDALEAMNRQIARTGETNMSALLRMDSRPEVNISLNTILKCMLLENNL